MGRLDGKIALITGSTRGIGRTMAEMFAVEGAKVMLCGRSVDKGEKVAAGIRDRGGDAVFTAVDITSEDSVRAVIEATVERFGGLTTLVNNAAPTDLVAYNQKRLHEFTTEEWTGVVNSALVGAVFWPTKYAVPHLIAGGGGTITNISSGAAMLGFSNLSAYSAGKGGMNSVTRSIAIEYAPEKIRCNVIVVGRIVSHAKDAGPEVKGIPLGSGVPSDIGHLAVYLASDESRFITGAIWPADGGQTANGDWD